MATVYSNILSAIGNTPLVRLDKTAKEEGLKCNLLAKCEFMNGGGSVKDRIALRMVEEAEVAGILIPGKSVIIEPSSGNTGIGLALVSAVKGYRCIITMPEKMSLEKENTLKALGAEVVRTPTEAPHHSPLSNLGRAKSLCKEIEHAVMLNQYGNTNNPDAHYYGTAPEILEALSIVPSDSTPPSSPGRPTTGTVDVMVAGAGTGGTLTGLARRLKEANPDVAIVGVDPRGSILARPEALNELAEGENEFYQVEGIGYDFIPQVLQHSYIDHWIKTSDSESFSTARHLIRTEGLLIGGSCGSALCGALKFLRSEEGRKWDREGVNVVVLFADSIRNYITAPWLSEVDEQVSSRAEQIEMLPPAQVLKTKEAHGLTGSMASISLEA